MFNATSVCGKMSSPNSASIPSVRCQGCLTQTNHLLNQQSGKCTTQIVREEDMDPGTANADHQPNSASGFIQAVQNNYISRGHGDLTHGHLFSLGTHQACNLLNRLTTACRSSCRSHILRGLDVVKGPIVLGIPQLVPNGPSYCWFYP